MVEASTALTTVRDTAGPSASDTVSNYLNLINMQWDESREEACTALTTVRDTAWASAFDKVSDYHNLISI